MLYIDTQKIDTAYANIANLINSKIDFNLIILLKHTVRPLYTGQSRSLKFGSLFQSFRDSEVSVCRKFVVCSQKNVRYLEMFAI